MVVGGCVLCDPGSCVSFTYGTNTQGKAVSGVRAWQKAIQKTLLERTPRCWRTSQNRESGAYYWSSPWEGSMTAVSQMRLPPPSWTLTFRKRETACLISLWVKDWRGGSHFHKRGNSMYTIIIGVSFILRCWGGGIGQLSDVRFRKRSVVFFYPAYGTVDQVFTLSCLFGAATEFADSVYVYFVDLERFMTWLLEGHVVYTARIRGTGPVLKGYMVPVCT